MPLKYLWLSSLLLIASVGNVHADANWRQNSNSKAATEGGSCVAETAFMRRNHFELIEHQRDITVRQGVRDTTDSLAGCVSCHTSFDKETGHAKPINAPGEFCAGCHEYTAVNIHCFDCHSTVPEGHKPPDVPGH
jgi:hypothetical protein